MSTYTPKADGPAIVTRKRTHMGVNMFGLSCDVWTAIASVANAVLVAVLVRFTYHYMKSAEAQAIAAHEQAVAS